MISHTELLRRFHDLKIRMRRRIMEDAVVGRDLGWEPYDGLVTAYNEFITGSVNEAKLQKVSDYLDRFEGYWLNE